MDKKEDRPRGKSPERDRRRAEVRHETNRMDPHSVRCRIFIGNLASDKVSRQELEEIFSKYGHISGCSLHNNYGFVQFDTEKSADEAVAKEDGRLILGKKVDVHLVSDKRKKGPPETRDSGRGGMRGPGGDRDRHSPPRDRGRMDDYGGRFPSRFGHPDDGFRRGPSPPRRDGFREPFDRPDDYHRDRYRDDPYDRREPPPPRRMYDDRRDPYDYPPRMDNRGDPYYDRDFRRDGPRRDEFRHDGPMRDEPRRDDARRDGPRRDEPYSRYDSYGRDFPDDYGPPSKKSRPEFEADYNKPIQAPTDCVVIVVNSVLYDYGIMVERKFKDCGLVTDLQPLGMRSMAELLDNITRHGVLYAAVVTTQHEVHRSVTINILHGTPQEHRNMPLEDALRLVSQNFEQYMQDLRKRAGDLEKDKEKEKEKEREKEREREREKERARELEREKEREREKSSRSSYGGSAPTKPATQEPDEMKKLLGKAASGGQLSSDELSKLIENLSKQKKQTESQGNQSSVGGPTVSQPQADANSIAKQQADLQAKIFSILNPSALSKALTVAQSVTGTSTVKAGSSTSTQMSAAAAAKSNSSAPLFPAAKALAGASASGYGISNTASGGAAVAQSGVYGSASTDHSSQQQSSAPAGYGIPKASVPSWNPVSAASANRNFSTPNQPAAQKTTPTSTNYGVPKASPTSYGVPKASPTSFGVPKASPTSYGVPKTSPTSFGVPKASPTSYGVPKASPTSYGVPKSSPASFGVPKASPSNLGASKTTNNSYGVPKATPAAQPASESSGYGQSGRGAPAKRGGLLGPGRGGVVRAGPPPGVTAVRGAAPPSARGGAARGGTPFQARGPAPRGPSGGMPTRGFPPRGGALGAPRYGVPFRGPAPQGAPISTVQGRGRQPPRY